MHQHSKIVQAITAATLLTAGGNCHTAYYAALHTQARAHTSDYAAYVGIMKLVAGGRL